VSSRCAAGKVPRFCLLAFAIILKPIAPCRQTAREFVASNNITAYVAILLQDFLLVYVSACPPCIPPSSKLPCDILDSDFCLFLNFDSTTSPNSCPIFACSPKFPQPFPAVSPCSFEAKTHVFSPQLAHDLFVFLQRVVLRVVLHYPSIEGKAFSPPVLLVVLVLFTRSTLFFADRSFAIF